MRRDHCSACASPDLDIFLDLGMSPVADAYTRHPDAPVARYPLELAVCGKCRLVQLLEVLDDKTLFGTGYSFYSSASPPLSAYHQRYATDVLRRHRALASRLTVEIGCNDGDLLRWFSSAGCLTAGVDPATGPVEVARSRGLEIANVAFGSGVAASLRDKLAASGESGAGIVIANHVLAHVPDVADFLAGLATLVADDGIVMVEVQYLPDLLVNNAFDLVYHEHRNFFSLTSLETAVGRVGLHIVDAELTDRQGGSLRVTLTKTPHQSQVVESIRAHERWLQDWGPYAGFQGRADRIRTRLLHLIYQEQAAGRVLVGYGAPAKATTLLNYCGITDAHLRYVVDSTPAKQGRYIPGTRLEIVAPTAAREWADTYVALAWNYTSEIMRGNPDYTGRWLVPIPAPILL